MTSDEIRGFYTADNVEKKIPLPDYSEIIVPVDAAKFLDGVMQNAIMSLFISGEANGTPTDRNVTAHCLEMAWLELFRDRAIATIGQKRFDQKVDEAKKILKEINDRKKSKIIRV